MFLWIVFFKVIYFILFFLFKKSKEIIDIPQIYIYGLIFSVLPFCFSIIFSLYVIIKERKISIHQFSFSLSISIFLLQSNIFSSLLEILQCQEIDNHYYLKNYLAESCETERYRIWKNYLVFPFLFLYIIAVPSILIYFMAKHWKNLYDQNVIRFIGFSLNGLKKDRFYWYFYFITLNYLFLKGNFCSFTLN